MTDTTLRPDSVDLNALIDAGYDDFLKKTTAQELEREHQARLHRERARKDFEDGLTAELGVDLVQALGVSLHVNEHQGEVEVTARFTYLDEPFGVSRSRTYARSGGEVYRFNWRLAPFAPYPQKPATWLRGFDPVTADSGDFRAMLLAGLGIARNLRAEYEALQREKQRQAEERRIQHEVEQARRDAEQAERERQHAEARAAWEAEQARLRSIVDAAREQALAGLFRWPDGVTVTVYKVQWCTAAVRDEEGGGYADYASAWTLADRLDEEGYVRVWQPLQKHERFIRLDLQAHKPIWERFSFDSIASLPRELVEYARTFVAGLTEGYLDQAPPGVDGWGLIEVPDASYPIDLEQTIPVAWVRSLVGRAAERNARPR